MLRLDSYDNDAEFDAYLQDYSQSTQPRRSKARQWYKKWQLNPDAQPKGKVKSMPWGEDPVPRPFQEWVLAQGVSATTASAYCMTVRQVLVTTYKATGKFDDLAVVDGFVGGQTLAWRARWQASERLYTEWRDMQPTDAPWPKLAPEINAPDLLLRAMWHLIERFDIPEKRLPKMVWAHVLPSIIPNTDPPAIEFYDFSPSPNVWYRRMTHYDDRWIIETMQKWAHPNTGPDDWMIPRAQGSKIPLREGDVSRMVARGALLPNPAPPPARPRDPNLKPPHLPTFEEYRAQLREQREVLWAEDPGRRPDKAVIEREDAEMLARHEKYMAEEPKRKAIAARCQAEYDALQAKYKAEREAKANAANRGA
jgi:hypothetical protein